MMPRLKVCSICGGVFTMNKEGYLQCHKCAKQIVPEAYHDPSTIRTDNSQTLENALNRIEELESALINKNQELQNLYMGKTKLQSQRDRLLEAVEWVNNLRNRNYGNATNMHIDMLEWPSIYRKAMEGEK